MDKRGDSKRYIERSNSSSKHFWIKLKNKFDAGTLLLLGFSILIFSLILNSSDITGYAIFRHELGIISFDVILFLIALAMILWGFRKCR